MSQKKIKLQANITDQHRQKKKNKKNKKKTLTKFKQTEFKNILKTSYIMTKWASYQ